LAKWFANDPETIDKLTTEELDNRDLVDLLALLIQNGVFFIC